MFLNRLFCPTPAQLPVSFTHHAKQAGTEKQTLVVTSLIFTEKRLKFILASCEVTEFIGGLTYTQRTYMCVHCAHSRWFLMVSSSAVAMAPVTHRWDMRAPPPPSSLWRPQHGDTLNTLAEAQRTDTSSGGGCDWGVCGTLCVCVSEKKLHNEWQWKGWRG